MLYGIEQSTDLRELATKVVKFRTQAAAERWARAGGGFAHDDPAAAKNFHHKLRALYEVEGRPPSKRELQRQADSWATPAYPRTVNDQLAYWICVHGRAL